MLKRIVNIIIFVVPFMAFCQDFSSLWEGHFSYNEIKDMSSGGNKIYAAATNAIFSLDLETNEMTEISTINGLSGETISTIYYSEDYELLVVGFENGLIEIVFDNGDDVLSVVDIIDKPTIPANDKKINHFNAHENVVYISTNFGISVFDLERLEFGDTYFIGTGGAQVQVSQTTILGDYIYASCLDGTGILKALVASPNLIDFQNWEVVTTGGWYAIEAIQDRVYAARAGNKLFQITSENVVAEVASYNSTPQDLRSINDNLVVTTRNKVTVYNSGFDVVAEVTVNEPFNTEYRCAIADSDYIYLGTKDFGILKTPILNPITFEEIHPEGPLLNTPFSLQVEPNGLWVSFGEYDLFYNPYPLNNRGISHLKNGEWINNEYSELFEAKCLNTIAVNPFNNNQIFISSFFSGLLEVNDDVPTVLYNETNSGLESLVLPNNPNYIDIRVGASAFDRDGILWLTTGLVDNQLKSYNPENNQWQSYPLKEVIANANDNSGFSDVVIDNNGVKWLGSLAFGVIGFNQSGSSQQIRALYKENENMPTERVSALALDNRNQLWIGTYRGIRVLYNTSNFFDASSVEADEIIIEENGVAKELLFQQYISDIKVDGSNNKWVGTVDSGLFYFSPNGQNTIFHFTKDNSPLPSNSIRDISLDNTNGIVYIATTKGLVSFRSGGSSPIDDLAGAYAYPNPIRPNFNMVEDKVKIKDISENVNIKITDIEGNLVAEGQSRTNQRYSGYNLEIDGGTAYWNGKNLANNVVASGVYLVMLSDLDTFETKVLKLMVVR